jgi:hypothetical protein
MSIAARCDIRYCPSLEQGSVYAGSARQVDRAGLDGYRRGILIWFAVLRRTAWKWDASYRTDAQDVKPPKKVKRRANAQNARLTLSY